MSYPVDNDINPGAINNHTQHPYSYAHPHPQHQLAQHGQHSHQQHQTPYFGVVPPFHSGNNGNSGNNNSNNDINPHHSQSPFSVVPAYSRPHFSLSAPSYGTIPPGALVTQEQVPSQTSTTSLPHKLPWDSEPETASHQHAGLTTGASSYQPDMRYIKGPLDVLNAEQYDDGRYTGKRGLYKPEAHALSTATTTSNPKKRGRKVLQNDRVEPVEEIKRARGRPRLETGDHQDMKERRKEQIRLAQRAYRNRKETAITDLEAKVAGLEASNLEVNAKFQSLLMEYVDKHEISAQIPELGRRLQQFQALLTERCADVASLGSDEATSGVKPLADTTLSERSQPESQAVGSDRPESQVAALSTAQQPQQLLGGIIVTHEPEPQSIIQDSAHASDTSPEDASYTFVRMANPGNASFGFNLGHLGHLGFLDSPMQSQWSLPHWDSLPMPSSGAFLERTFGRRLHRRTTEKAATLLAMKNPPYDTMHRVFGFVRNYATLDNIRQRIKTTLSRNADEDMDAYAQPFHHIGGSGTHFASDAKTITFPGGAPFQNSGYGMGPFNEKTTAVRDDLLDALQHTKFPGWQGEWFDSYEVEQYLAQRLINLPQDGDGYVEIPPGEFYDNPLDEASATKISDSLQGSISRKVGAGFDISPDVGEGMSMHSTGQQETIVRNNATYPSPVSSIDSMLSIPATADLWPMGADFLAMTSQTMSGNMSTLPAYHNTTTSLGFPDSSRFIYSSPSTMDLVSGQTRNKRVWFSVDKFIESLGSKSTCAGRGPAFRKRDIVTAFWEAAKPGPE
ncbi:hypothetical protein F5Y12DRAFT_716635 [Xylaria sp. FL1777]|nr:hypothetical protein F5Y12DRAFT_716635 [Xylaria sp. FL1777]